MSLSKPAGDDRPVDLLQQRRGRYLFSVLGSSVTAHPSALITLFVLFGTGLGLAGLRFRQPTLIDRLRYALLTLVGYYTADTFHLLGHLLSARYAGAPLDHIYITAPLPQTLYDDNDVEPRTHCLRAVGGPVGSGWGFILARLLRRLTPANSAMRDLLNLIALANGLTSLGSFYPLPIVDGGTLLKWSLVEGGTPPPEADKVVQKTNLVLGIASLIGIMLAGKQLSRWAISFLKSAISGE
jgi:hypothetical protein